ncbi:MAG: DUF4304 domain-containing protein [Phycisphaerales bacterium]|nr:DUF4304 domain-containing protein [Phycisphaerales bacterium]
MSEDQTWTHLAFDRLIQDHVAPALKAQGYKKQGLNWRLFRPDTPARWQVVSLQKSRFSNREEISFTFELGIHWIDAPSTHLPPLGKSGPSVQSCQLQSRIGRLDSEHRDIWWDIDGGRWGPGHGPDCLEPVLAQLMPLLNESLPLWMHKYRQLPTTLDADADMLHMPSYMLIPGQRFESK